MKPRVVRKICKRKGLVWSQRVREKKKAQNPEGRMPPKNSKVQAEMKVIRAKGMRKKHLLKWQAKAAARDRVSLLRELGILCKKWQGKVRIRVEEEKGAHQ